MAGTLNVYEHDTKLTCCFINGDKISRLNRSTTITVRFHTAPLRLSIYVLYTKRHLLLKQGGDKATVNFRETKFKPVSKPVASSTLQHCHADHFDNTYMVVCDLSLQQGNTESRKYIEQRTVLIRLMLQLFSRYHVFTNSVARLSNIQVNHRPNDNHSIRSIEARAEVSFFKLCCGSDLSSSPVKQIFGHFTHQTECTSKAEHGMLLPLYYYMHGNTSPFGWLGTGLKNYFIVTNFPKVGRMVFA